MLGSLIACMLRCTGGTATHPETFDFKPLADIQCQLDGEGELNVPCSARFKSFMHCVFGGPMTMSIIQYVAFKGQRDRDGDGPALAIQLC